MCIFSRVSLKSISIRLMQINIKFKTRILLAITTRGSPKEYLSNSTGRNKLDIRISLRKLTSEKRLKFRSQDRKLNKL